MHKNLYALVKNNNPHKRKVASKLFATLIVAYFLKVFMIPEV